MSAPRPIVVLSQSLVDRPTEAVLDWLRHLGARVERVNGDEIADETGFAMELGEGAAPTTFEVDGERITEEDVAAVWYRRFHRHGSLAHLRDRSNPGLGAWIELFLNREALVIRDAMGGAFGSKPWLSRVPNAPLNKLNVLRAATQAGLAVPATLVTNRRASLEDFIRRHGRVICKPISEIEAFHVGEREYSMYTAEVTPEVLASVPERFYPSLVQEMVHKRYELRIFYLRGRCWSMAMFSQANAQTVVDFRQYDFKRPNRWVPYSLAPELEAAVVRLMDALELETGSLDIIRAQDGRDVFLEVNPNGQLGMVSSTCNYRLERRIAEHLMELAGHER